MDHAYSLLRRYHRRSARPSRFRAYGEVPFRYLLTIERERCRRAGRPLVVVLVDGDASSGVAPLLNRRLARRLFANLSRCLRETDVIGWYLDHRVAGVVLTELGAEAGANVGDLVVGRIRGALRAALRPSLAARLRVRLMLNTELVSGGVTC